MYKSRGQKKHRFARIFVPLLLLLIILAVIYFLLTKYEVKNIYVDGNLHYTSEEIQEMVMGGIFGKNSLYLSLKYKNKGIHDIPFIDNIKVDILSPDTIRITVYEKALAGFVEYLGRYMYFDKDGTVVESSIVKTVGIPQITGLQFDYIILGKKLPVESETVFKTILNTSQILSKYSLVADKIFFNSAKHMTVFFENVKVVLGNEEYLEEKIMMLPQMLPTLQGKSGTLRMDNYSEETKSYSFEPDN